MNYLLNGSLEHQNNISFDLKQVILKATQLDYKNRYNSVKEMDLAIQQKLVVIPPLNNDTFKSKMISLAWIVFTLMIVVDMEPGETINNSFIIEPLITEVTRFLGTGFYRNLSYQAIPAVPAVFY